MINFIVVDDNVEIAKKCEGIINKVMMKNTHEYKTRVFNDYDYKFNKVMNNKLPNKVYILDIETKSASGIDIARKIRTNDLESVIIFITAHEELGGVIIKESLMVLTFICKFDNFDSRLRDAIKKSLAVVGVRSVIRFNDGNSLYTIPTKDILYITRDSVERKCIIKTDYASYKVSKTLTELKTITDGLFTQSHRACLVNQERIVKIDKTNKIITFDNGMTTDLISDNFKKELV